MNHVVLALEAVFDKRKSYRAGEIISVHSNRLNANERAEKLRRTHGQESVAHLELAEPAKRGDIHPELLQQALQEQYDRRAVRALRSILSVELDGKEDGFFNMALGECAQLGLTLEELSERYESRVRDEHAAEVARTQESAQLRARKYEVQKAVNEIRQEITYTFPAVRGIQAGKEYFIAQIPYSILVRLFVFDEEQVPAELRAQRALNPRRAQAIADYMVENKDSYVLPALTASVSKEMCFEASPVPGSSDRLGLLHVPMDAVMLINDGQHRRGGIELALQQDPSLRHETSAVTIFYDQGLERSQQIFADINSKQVKPSGAINALYDHRNPFNAWVLDVLKRVPEVRKRIDFENSSVAAKSHKLWSMVAFKKFITRLTGLNEKTIQTAQPVELDDIGALVVRFFNECESHIPGWRGMMDHSVSASEIRESMVIGHAVWLEALGLFGSVALFAGDYLVPLDRSAKVIDADRARFEVMQLLADVQPDKTAPQWQGRCVHLGRMQKTADGVKSTAAVLLKLANVKLPDDLAEVDGRVEAANPV